ncbi:MAG: hypothetical protein Q8P98_01565, partial [Candidatus Rokubacteria bacterium]|nr:hypothetical protein [Candidatus Rokubacteria bacterium]
GKELAHGARLASVEILKAIEEPVRAVVFDFDDTIFTGGTFWKEVKTAMTAGLPVPPFAGEPDAVARVVLRAIDRGTPVVYAPPIWRWVMLAIRLLPRAVMRRVRF